MLRTGKPVRGQGGAGGPPAVTGWHMRKEGSRLSRLPDERTTRAFRILR